MLLLCRVFLTHCQLGMVIYLQADIGRINALFRKAHRWQLTDRSIQELEAEADIKLGILLTFCTNYYLHTDQFNIHFENEVIRSSYPPRPQYNVLQINIRKPVTFPVSLILR